MSQYFNLEDLRERTSHSHEKNRGGVIWMRRLVDATWNEIVISQRNNSQTIRGKWQKPCADVEGGPGQYILLCQYCFIKAIVACNC